MGESALLLRVETVVVAGLVQGGDLVGVCRFDDYAGRLHWIGVVHGSRGEDVDVVTAAHHADGPVVVERFHFGRFVLADGNGAGVGMVRFHDRGHRW